MTAIFPIRLRKRGLNRAAALTTVIDADEEEQRYKPIDLALVRRMLGLLAPYRWQYALGVTLGAAQVTLEMQSPKFTQAIIDHCSAWLAHLGRAPGAAAAAAPPTTWIIRAVSAA